jgi:hypothetical protein
MLKMARLKKTRQEVVTNYLKTKLGWLKRREEVPHLGPEPDFLLVLRVIGAEYLPTWDMLKVDEFQGWLFGHLDALTDIGKWRHIFEHSMAAWIEAARKGKKTRTKKGDSEELKAMEKVLQASKSEEELTELAKIAILWITQARDLYWVQQSNIDPNYECNERVLLKFWDWKFSPLGIAEKAKCGTLAMTHQCARLKDLGHFEPWKKSFDEVTFLTPYTALSHV